MLYMLLTMIGNKKNTKLMLLPVRNMFFRNTCSLLVRRDYFYTSSFINAGKVKHSRLDNIAQRLSLIVQEGPRVIKITRLLTR